MMHELFYPLLKTFSCLLGFGLLAVLFAMALSKDAVLKKQLILRWLSWALIAPITMLSILSGPAVFAVLASLVALACCFEYCKMSKRSRSDTAILLVASASMPLLAYSLPALIPGAVTVAFLLLLLASLRKSRAFDSSWVSFLALAYVPVLSCHAVLLYKLSLIGPALLISIVTASALANIVAFVFGKLLGGPKLAETISPNKTWSGVLGSVLGSYLGFGILSLSSHLSLPLVSILVIPLVVAAAGVLGDLFESALKRSFHVKDAGSWLPGFGGALDRVDGLLFVLPSVYYLVSFAH